MGGFCLGTLCTTLISCWQSLPQTGEQELECLVLKLSVLKDFLSGIQKKVNGSALTCPAVTYPSIRGAPPCHIPHEVLTFSLISLGPKGTAGHELHSTSGSIAAFHTKGQNHSCAGL